MAQGGLHRGVAVCRCNPGSPVTQPAPGLVSVFPVLQPITPHVSAQVHHGWGPSARMWGLFNARPGLGRGVRRRRGRGKGQSPPLRCSLRRGDGTYPRPRQSGSTCTKGRPPKHWRIVDRDGRGGPPCYSGPRGGIFAL